MAWPSGIYGAAKIWGEALGRHFADAHGLSVLCVRIGMVRAADRPQLPRDYSIYLSHRDVVQILTQCIEAPDDLRYDVFMATSKTSGLPRPRARAPGARLRAAGFRRYVPDPAFRSG